MSEQPPTIQHIPESEKGREAVDMIALLRELGEDEKNILNAVRKHFGFDSPLLPRS